MDPTRVSLCLLILLSVAAPHATAQIPRAADAPQPLPPEESQQQFQLPEGLRIELVASEPLLADPSAIMIDDRGRFFVCELHGYNLEGHLDIVELNKSRELDREVRRVRVEGALLDQAKRARTGTVKRLIDRNSDGRMDDVQVWADDLPPCYGMVPYRDGLIVVCGPEIVYLEDRNGDGTADVRKTLFTGFDVEVMERAINTPLWGLDNWIYVAAGGAAASIAGPGLQAPVNLGRTDFRFRPDGSAIEAVSGTNGTFGHAFTDFGDRFIISTSTPAYLVVPLPRQYLLRNPFAPSPSPSINVANYNRIYPTSRPHPWRAARGADPAWVKFYGGQEATPNGFFTSGCSPLVYRANALPAQYAGNYFCCDPSNNLVHRTILHRDGAGFRVQRAAAEESREFLTSVDQWFRPMNLYLGPDGAIYIVDLYREIIEDYSAIPRFLQQQYGLIEGQDHGRIWRIVSESAAHVRWPQPRRPSNAELVEWLQDPNAWWRQNGQRLLIDRRAKAAHASLRRLCSQARLAASRVHALYTLAGAQALDAGTVRQSLRDPDPGVRRHALRLAEQWLEQDAGLLTAVTTLTNDDAPQVRLQLALTLGESRQPPALAALAELARRYGQERWMVSAIVCSVAERAAPLIAQLAQSEVLTEGSLACLGPLAACVGARQQSAELDRVLATAAGWRGADASAGQVALLTGLSEALERNEAPAVTSTSGQVALETLLSLREAPVVRLAFGVASRLKLTDSLLLQQAFQQSIRVVLDAEHDVEERLASLQLLKHASWPSRAQLVELVDARQAPEVQSAAIATIAFGDEEQVAEVLLTRWEGLSPKVQEAIADALFARPARLPSLLDAIEAVRVPPNSLTSLRRAQLLEHSDPVVRSRAEALLGGATTEARTAVVQRYHSALQLDRDPVRGRAVFDKQCSKCHRLQQRGFAVGPDLSAAQGRPDVALLVDLFDPSSDIKPGYSVATALTRDGRSFTGVLAEEAATSVTLRREQGVQHTILRRQIDELQVSSKSMMPDGLEGEMTLQDVADLIGYLREALGPPTPTGVALFDDERSLADSLTQGSGSAEIWSQDMASGNVSLRVTPPQKYCARIQNWNYKIVENPLPGEYRYLRLAWKAPDATGVMLEIAASGSWPPSDSPLRRYFAGQNTTDWQARQVAAEPPRDWSVVTVDLFKDCGEFTLTGLAPTAMGGPAFFDRIVLLRSLDEPAPPPAKALAE